MAAAIAGTLLREGDSFVRTKGLRLTRRVRVAFAGSELLRASRASSIGKLEFDAERYWHESELSVVVADPMQPCFRERRQPSESECRSKSSVDAEVRDGATDVALVVYPDAGSHVRSQMRAGEGIYGIHRAPCDADPSVMDADYVLSMRTEFAVEPFNPRMHW